MGFKKPSKEDMPIVIISAIIVTILEISSAISKSEETGEPILFYQWLIVNLSYRIRVAVIPGLFALGSVILAKAVIIYSIAEVHGRRKMAECKKIKCLDCAEAAAKFTKCYSNVLC